MKLLNINTVRSFVIAITCTFVLALSSCGEDEAAITQGQQILEAIEGTWSFTTENIPDNIALSDPSITVVSSQGSKSAGFVPDASSGLSNFISGGSFSVADDGTISNAIVISATGSKLGISGADVTATTEQLVISFTTSQSSGRVAGLGSWTITIPLN